MRAIFLTGSQVRDLGIFAKSFFPPWPKILGVDGAGILRVIGSRVRRFRLGDRVAGYVRMNKGNLVGAFSGTGRNVV
jgi:NADPH:quinone reductase-like Zn-dependent oxidoreductase